MEGWDGMTCHKITKINVTAGHAPGENASQTISVNNDETLLLAMENNNSIPMEEAGAEGRLAWGGGGGTGQGAFGHLFCDTWVGGACV